MRSRPTEAEWLANLIRLYCNRPGGRMKKAHPEKSIRILSYGVNGLSASNNVQRLAKMKYDLKAAMLLICRQGLASIQTLVR